MQVLRTILLIIFIIICISMVILVLMQEGKSAGLGAISGAAETYWGKIKGVRWKAALVKIIKIFGGMVSLFGSYLKSKCILKKCTKASLQKSRAFLFFMRSPVQRKYDAMGRTGRAGRTIL